MTIETYPFQRNLALGYLAIIVFIVIVATSKKAEAKEPIEK
jgi:hypothetical protein